MITLYREDHPVVIEYKDGTTAYYDFPENPDQSVTLLTDIDELFYSLYRRRYGAVCDGEDGLEVVLTLDAIESQMRPERGQKIRR